jgi:hypothetical protein
VEGDLVDDGRALTAASETIREALNEVDALADKLNKQARTDFESMWKEDEAITRATEVTLQIDMELGRAIDIAVRRLEEAMLRIGKKYEEESPKD